MRKIKKYDKDLNYLLKIYHRLTDKKLIKTITIEEEKQLEKIRKDIESYIDDKNLMNFYKNKTDKYIELLDEINKIKKLLMDNKKKIILRPGGDRHGELK